MPRIPLPHPLNLEPFASVQGLAAGLSRARMRGPDLQRPFHGVRHPGDGTLDLPQLCAAYLRRMPRGAFFCSVTAATIIGMPLPLGLKLDRRLHVGVPSPARAPSARGVVGHKLQLVGGDLRRWHELPVSTPERTWCDLAASLSLADLVAAGDYLLFWESPLTTSQRLAEWVEKHPGRRARSRLVEASTMLSDRAESAPESIVRVIMAKAGITGIVPNLSIEVPGKRYRADLALPGLKIAIEYLGDYHRDREQYRKDVTRKSRLEAAGWYVFEIAADDLLDPAELVARMKSVIATRSRP